MSDPGRKWWSAAVGAGEHRGLGAGTVQRLGKRWRWKAQRQKKYHCGSLVATRELAELGLAEFLASAPPRLRTGPIKFPDAIRSSLDDQCTDDVVGDGRNRCYLATEDGEPPCTGTCAMKVCQECTDTTETELVGDMWLCDGCRYSWKVGLGL